MSTITKKDLIDFIALNMKLSKKNAVQFVEMFFTEIALTLKKGDNVKLTKFGNFNLRNKQQRLGRNPLTREVAPITARRVVTFKTSIQLKKKINNNLLVE
jgi:integration host factor subunit alpha